MLTCICTNEGEKKKKKDSTNINTDQTELEEQKPLEEGFLFTTTQWLHHVLAQNGHQDTEPKSTERKQVEAENRKPMGRKRRG